MKKQSFSPYILLAAAAAILCTIGCTPEKSEQDIRAQVEKEIMAELSAAMEQPANILTRFETQLVASQFPNIKPQVGSETPVCKLPDGSVITFFLDKNGDYTLFSESNGKKQEAFTMVGVPVAMLPELNKPIGCWLGAPGADCTTPPIFEFKKPVITDFNAWLLTGFCQPLPCNENLSCVEKCMNRGWSREYCETWDCLQMQNFKFEHLKEWKFPPL